LKPEIVDLTDESTMALPRPSNVAGYVKSSAMTSITQTEYGTAEQRMRSIRKVKQSELE
jgi:hypothetical protein